MERKENTILDGDSKEVSLRLADHHIGITHGGDGCGRRIVDFDERAIKLSEIESAKDNLLDERIGIALEKQQDAQADMPTVPDTSAAKVWVVC